MFIIADDQEKVEKLLRDFDKKTMFRSPVQHLFLVDKSDSVESEALDQEVAQEDSSLFGHTSVMIWLEHHYCHLSFHLGSGFLQSHH